MMTHNDPALFTFLAGLALGGRACWRLATDRATSEARGIATRASNDLAVAKWLRNAAIVEREAAERDKQVAARSERRAIEALREKGELISAVDRYFRRQVYEGRHMGDECGGMRYEKPGTGKGVA
jgi:hypothetical protein